MGKRCIEINCSYLATDNTCLLPVRFHKEYCKALERVKHEDKDVWMDNVK